MLNQVTSANDTCCAGRIVRHRDHALINSDRVSQARDLPRDPPSTRLNADLRIVRYLLSIDAEGVEPVVAAAFHTGARVARAPVDRAVDDGRRRIDRASGLI